MNFLILVLLFCQAFFCSTNAASHNKILVQEDRTIILNKVIENGKSSNVETDRHMHLDWDRFRQLKSEYDSKFDELICTDPDQLRDMHRELDELSKKVELGWNLKQEQLDDLVDVLHNENYNATGLSTGNEGVDDLCQGLQEYIDKVNHTAWEVEKPELDDHLQEVIDIKIAIDTHPCPCVWGEWSIWSDCSTTCEAGERSRERVILKVAINNGTECEGDHDESEVCNADVCCPVNCVWNLWEEWNACPSGCDQHTTRTRTKAVVAVCNGTDCIGEDFEEKSCFRERELEDKIAVLKQQIDQCQDNPTTISYNGIASENNIVKIFDTWGPNYKISFRMKFNASLRDGWYNLFQFTTTTKKGWPITDYGDRIPAVYFYSAGGKIKVFVTMTNVKTLVLSAQPTWSKTYYSTLVPLDTWHEVELEQKVTSQNQDIFTFKLNGQLKWSTQPKFTIFKNVKWYQSCPKEFYQSIGNHADIKGMKVTNEQL